MVLAVPPLVSFLLPTRGRVSLAARSIESIYNTATDRASIEICLGIDTDDSESLALLPRLKELKVAFQWVEFSRHGYAGLHHYNNELARNASGRWLAIWNDDLLLRTDGWDDKIAALGPTFCLLDPCAANAAPQFQYGLFPMVPAAWRDTLGYLSASRHCDTYMCLIADALRLRHKTSDIELFHDRFDETGANNDATYRDRCYGTDSFYDDPATLGRLNLDIRRLARVLGVPAGGITRVADAKTIVAISARHHVVTETGVQQGGFHAGAADVGPQAP